MKKIVMTITNANANLNRPVHQGRRDVFLERAIKLFPECLKPLPVEKRRSHIDAVLYYLHSALEPATMAVKSPHADPLEAALVAFLRLAYCTLHSARMVMDHESQLDNARNPVRQFLHSFQGVRMNGDGQKKSDLDLLQSHKQLFQDVDRLFRMAEAPFQDLQKKLVNAMSGEERARYRRARETLKVHAPAPDQLRRAVHIPPHFPSGF